MIQIGALNGSVFLGQSERRTVRLLPATTSVFKNRKPEFEYFALAGPATEGHALETPSAKVESLRSMIEERPVALLLDDAQTAAVAAVDTRPPLRRESGRGTVLHERRFVQLHPLGTRGAQVGQDLGVDGQQTVQQRQRLEVVRDTGGGLGRQQVRDGSHQHRPRGEPEREGLPQPGRSPPQGIGADGAFQ